MVSNYNFYDPVLDSNVVHEAQKNQIVGWTGDQKVLGGVPQGKPVYWGYDQNAHLQGEDHGGAAQALRLRANRIRDALSQGQIAKDDADVVKQELALTEAQRDQHSRAHVAHRASKRAVAPTSRPVMAKSEPPALIESLRRLLKAIRRG